MKQTKPKGVKLSKDGKRLIKVSRDYEGELILPESVTTIESCAFFGCDKITSVVLPSGITTIGRRAFVCSSITEITIPETVKVIEVSAFFYCKKLKKVTFNNGLEKIKQEAFQNCAITDIFIPKSVVEIDFSAFEHCPIERLRVEDGNPIYDSRNNCNAIIETAKNLLLVGCNTTTIPPTIEEIGDVAFYSAIKLESIYIPQSVKKIGQEAFRFCPNLRYIDVDPANSVYDSRDNCNAIIETSTDKLILGSSTTHIPQSVVSIGESAFAFRISLTEIAIPDNVKIIEQKAFLKCENLTEVTLPSELKILSTYVFAHCKNLENIHLPEGLEVIEKGAILDCGKLEDITIPNSVNTIGGHLCHNGVKHLYIPENVTSISNDVLIGNQLESIKVSKDNAKYDSRDNCNAIIETATDTLIASCAKTVIPESIKIIAQNVFFHVGLKNITIPKGVLSLGNNAFCECTSLEHVDIPNSVTLISDAAFMCCKTLSSITLPKNLTYIGNLAFSMCYSLTSIVIPEGVISIGERAFELCDNLTSIVFPSTLQSIGKEVLYGTPKIEEIIVPIGQKERFLKMGLKKYEKYIVEK